MTLLTATAAQVYVLRPQPGSSPPCPSDLRARLESLSIWAHGASLGRRAARQNGCWAGRRVRGRQTAQVVSVSNSPAELVTFVCLNVRSLHNKTDDIIVQEQAEDILVPPLLRNFVLHFPFLVIASPLRNSGPCDSFDNLGHSKNV